jgi:hypothetical protein
MINKCSYYRQVVRQSGSLHLDSLLSNGRDDSLPQTEISSLDESIVSLIVESLTSLDLLGNKAIKVPLVCVVATLLSEKELGTQLLLRDGVSGNQLSS